MKSVNPVAEEILHWMCNNKWLAEKPAQHDFSFDYFYNFMRTKIEGLTPKKLNDELLELQHLGLAEIALYPTSTQVHIIRGLTLQGKIYCELKKLSL